MPTSAILNEETAAFGVPSLDPKAVVHYHLFLQMKKVFFSRFAIIYVLSNFSIFFCKWQKKSKLSHN